MTFVVDTTKSVRPDKYSIFNLTQKVVERIVETKANIPSYLLVGDALFDACLVSKIPFL